MTGCPKCGIAYTVEFRRRTLEFALHQDPKRPGILTVGMWLSLIYAGWIVVWLLMGLVTGDHLVDGLKVTAGYFYVSAALIVPLNAGLVVGAGIGLWRHAPWSRLVMALFWPAESAIVLAFGALRGQGLGEMLVNHAGTLMIAALAYAYLYIAPESNMYFATLKWREQLQEALDSIRIAPRVTGSCQ